LVVCSTCHDSHAGVPYHSEVENGAGTPDDIFLRNNAGGDSPLCTACHNDKSVVEATDHDLRKIIPDEPVSDNMSAEDAGLCLQCHAVHNALSESFLMNRVPGPEIIAGWDKKTSAPGAMTGMCTSCHQPGQCAQEKIPLYGLHPPRLYTGMISSESNVSDRNVKHSAGMYLLMDNETAPGLEDIVCTTCHDPHVWNSSRPEKGCGINTEGNITTSFLKYHVDARFCSACHGEETLYRFMYFHKNKGRNMPGVVEKEGE
jgi:hypothetical protein